MCFGTVFAACDDGEKTQPEFFTVTINSADGGYKIIRCEDSDVVARSSNGELEETFLLTATKGEGRCYRVMFDYVDGLETPDYIEEYLAIGAPIEVEGLYSSIDSEELVTIRTNNAFGSWTVYRVADDVAVGTGPFTTDEGDEWHSYKLEATAASPGIEYKIYYGDIDGCTTPDATKFELIAGNPMSFTANYQCDSSDTDI